MDIPSPDSAPAALADLIAAGLVSHEMIGDPGRFAGAGGGEAEALRRLCGLVAGPVWRLEPFHYAFRIAPGDLGGTRDGASVEARAAALEAALAEALGPEAVWVNPADLAPARAAALPEAPLLLLRAQAEAVAEVLAAAGPGVQAVIGARLAAATARLAADLAPPSSGPAPDLAGRLAALESGQAALAAAAAAEAARAAEARAGQGAALDRLAGSVAALAAGLDAAAARDSAARETLAGFRESVGLALAEFLAALERRDAPAAPGRVPQVG